MSKNYCLIMAGGRGTRFWPESTKANPKQYLKILGGKSPLEQTLLRFEGIIEASNRFIITASDQLILAQENAKEYLPMSNILVEPEGRNTAPCIYLSLLLLKKHGAQNDDVISIVPADHVILDIPGFQQGLVKAISLAKNEKKICTIGVKPHFPHTGYGYIHRGNAIDEKSFNLKEFKEKPDRVTAEKYLKTGEYYWNAGMFVGEIGIFLEEFSSHCPQYTKFQTKLEQSLGNEENLAKIYTQLENNSIDFALMEKSSRVCVTEANFDWNDLGSWDAMEQVLKKTEGNTFVHSVKEDDYFLKDAIGNIVYAPGKFTALYNVNDLVVISSGDYLVVIPKKDAQKVKEIALKLDYQK